MIKTLIAFIYFILFNLTVFAQLTFDHISVIDGLSQSTVLSICKDKRGFMWFGTRDGLNRYDGKTIKKYKNDPSNHNSLIFDDYIYTIVEDRYQKLWVGTQRGVSYYSPETDSFEQIDYRIAGQKDPSSFAVLSILPANDGKIWFATTDGLLYINNSTSRDFKRITKSKGLAGTEVYSLFEDNLGNIWAGTVTGLSKLTISKNKETYVVKNYFHDKNNPQSLSANFVRSMAQDTKGQIWLGIENGGVNLYRPGSDDFQRFTSHNSKLNNDLVRKILTTQNGTMWIGTMNGLNVYNPLTKEFHVYKQDYENSKGISDNSIKDIYQDNNGSVWIGTNFGGVNVVHKNTLGFDTFSHNEYKTNSISGNIVSVLASDKSGNLWIGTEGRGLNMYNIKNRTFKHFNYNESNSEAIGSNTIKSIYVDKKNNVWVGLFEGGLELYNPKTGSFKHFRPNADDPKTLNHGYISAIDEDVHGNLWIGTSTKGINILNPTTQIFTHINTSTKEGLSSNYIKSILIDSKENIWIGTVLGINLLKKGASKFISLNKENGLGSNYINCIKEDQNGEVWIGTHKGGLNLYLPKENKFKQYSEADGLMSDNVVGIDFDSENNLWISTDNGLSMLDVKKKTFKNFDNNDGLPSNEFSLNSSAKDDEGNLYFGTIRGLIKFKPKGTIFNNNPPHILFTGLKLFNQNVKVGGEDGILDKDISFKDQLVFKANHNIFTIDFIGFNYINSKRNKYAYKLDGFEKEWNYVDNPSATYTNLPAGTYTLLVKGANNDGVWTTHPKELLIKVLPPFWKTWWAYLVYVALFLFIWYKVNTFLRKQQRLETDLYYEQINHERQEELYQSKLEFFTRISHEIRTPLTLIFAPLERLIESTTHDNGLNKQLVSIKTNTERLLRLISELLDFRKIDTGNLKLERKTVLLNDFCSQIYESFKGQAELKDIQFDFIADQKVFASIDIHQMEKVLFNLLSNAFKYTAPHGKVTMRLSASGDTIDLTVEDNGMGIVAEEQQKIFNNFYQSKNEQVKHVGWGIGLALVKSIVELHGGKISLASTPQSQQLPGTTSFTINLKREYVAASDDHIPALFETASRPFVEIDETEKKVEVLEKEKSQAEKQETRTILIVEDNDELRTFLAESLSQKYQVMEASDGQEGLEIAVQHVPDIIVSDVTMPHMDGFDFCRLIKELEVTNHIPVIMLTAMASHLHQVDGLQSGANIYLTKPFSMQLLELHIDNLFKSREALRSKFSKQVTLMPRNIEIEDPEEKFLNKVMLLIEENMEDAEFNVALLVDKIGMSQTVLYKKIKALTGMTITDFIKSIRLKRAAQLLKQRKINIAEVAYTVGFNDRKYFSREFKKQFGKSPSEYLEEADLG